MYRESHLIDHIGGGEELSWSESKAGRIETPATWFTNEGEDMTGPPNDDKNDRRWKTIQVLVTAWNASAATARLLWELLKNHRP